MIPMTTQQLGQQPGRARLGACGHRHNVPTPHARRADAWRPWAALGHDATLATDVPVYTTDVAMSSVCNPTRTTGFGSIKGTARHLGKGST